MRTDRLRLNDKTDEELIEIFWSRVNKTDTCWLWTGGKSREYGIFTTHGQPIAAHRYAFKITNGYLPLKRNEVLDHYCNVKLCVRPDPRHVRHVTNQENVLRGINRNRDKTHCKRGHEFTQENITIPQNTARYGYRLCKECKRLNSRNSRINKIRGI